MKTGKRWSFGKSRSAAFLLALPFLLHAPGCAKDRAIVEKNLLAKQTIQGNEAVAERYRIGCPDVIELEISQRPEFNGRYTIGPDGRIDLGDYGKPRLQGRTLTEIAQVLAEETGASLESIKVRVVDHRSQHLVLLGEVIGWQRSVPYRGQETVLDLLQRVGGITPGAEPNDVYVVRPHLGESHRPEVFRVDLNAIVIKHDHRTNIRLLPFDQIYVGETRQAKVEKAIPPWLRQISQALWDTKPAPEAKADGPKAKE